MQRFHELAKDFHIWSQGIYPGEFSYFPSLGPEFRGVEVDFDHMRSQILALMEGLAEGYFTDPRNAINNNLSDLTLMEKFLRELGADELNTSVYMAWIDTSRVLLIKALALL